MHIYLLIINLMEKMMLFNTIFFDEITVWWDRVKSGDEKYVSHS